MSSDPLSSTNNEGRCTPPTSQRGPAGAPAEPSHPAPAGAAVDEARRAPGGPFAGRSPAELADTIGQLHALSCAATGVMLEAVAAYDATGAWRDDGAGSLGQWLCYALGVTTATGAQYARVATALVDLPVLSSALAAGRVGVGAVGGP